jgi:hypothetical protein
LPLVFQGTEFPPAASMASNLEKLQMHIVRRLAIAGVAAALSFGAAAADISGAGATFP